jgi:hypothetical protein
MLIDEESLTTTLNRLGLNFIGALWRRRLVCADNFFGRLVTVHERSRRKRV